MVEKEILNKVEAIVDEHGLRVVDKDLERPWGGFLVIDEAQAEQFAETYFPDLDVSDQGGKMHPKFLIFAPGERLSWQYHNRRWEIWRAIWPTGVMISDTDRETEARTLSPGEVVKITEGTRHRSMPTDDWGLVAEIWFHIDPEHPSDEEDIVRLQDDYHRS